MSSVNDLSAPADAVVLASGLRGAELLGDDDHPEGVSYIIPRRDDIIVGGTDVAHDTNFEVGEQTAADMLKRAIDLVPKLAQCEILEHKVGLRPARKNDPLRAGSRIRYDGYHGFWSRRRRSNPVLGYRATGAGIARRLGAACTFITRARY